MKTLEFNINIAASPEKVSKIMLEPATYKEWVNVSWPGSIYEGTWKKGGNLRFISQGQGGTLATLEEFKPNEFILARHIAVILSDGSEDTDSDMAKGWIGTTESYTFTEKNGGTELKVEIKTNPAWEKMFAEGWPKALDKLKELCES